VNYRSLRIALCKFPSVGERQHQNVPNPAARARTVCETQQSPRESHLPAPRITPEPRPQQPQTEGETRGGWIPPATESGQRGPRRPRDSNPPRSLQCALCFLFLCFLSFFLLAHLEQNHCTSSGGAVVIPTQGLGRTGKYRTGSAESRHFCSSPLKAIKLSSGRHNLASKLIQ